MDANLVSKSSENLTDKSEQTPPVAHVDHIDDGDMSMISSCFHMGIPFVYYLTAPGKDGLLKILSNVSISVRHN